VGALRRWTVENDQIKQAGLKVTAPRLKILSVLEASDKRHLSAEDVYRMLLSNGEDIGLATVYRVLTQFEGAGLVCRHHFETGQSVFELNRGGHHDHLVCVKCDKVVEFMEPAIEHRQEAIAKEHGFTLEDHSLVIYGICPDCQAKG
jgi:Fur family transcriptional regulator, ferric uptake regulator